MARKLGCGDGPAIFFFQPRGLEAAELKESKGDHGHQGVPLEPNPGSAFDLIKAKFLFRLLVRLFADPSRLEVGVSGEIGNIIFALANEPDFLARHARHAAIVLISVRD